MTATIPIPRVRTHAHAAGDRATRPFAFLVSTTTDARGIRDRMGTPAYSYYFVVEALAPVLERLGTWRIVDHPESRLAFAAARAEEEGYRPVHLAVNPLQDVYLSPSLPNILLPFWEFPDLPDRDFGTDTRQNWVRIARRAALVLTACRFTARAFERAGLKCPTRVVPTPVHASAFELPAWDRSFEWSLTCRHEVLGPEPRPVEPAIAQAPESSDARPSGPVWNVARRGFRKLIPWLPPELVTSITLTRRALSRAIRRPDQFLYVALRDGYRRHIQRWLSAEALARISNAKARVLARLGRAPIVVPDPPLPSGPLTLGNGLVYLTMFNVGDPRKNYLDILTAYLDAFRDRPDVTLVIKLVTNRITEHNEAGLLRARYRALGIDHRCRVVVVTEFLDDRQMQQLFRVATCYVNASHAEGACLPLMRALAGGRPSIAPDHSAMADYMDDAVGFVPRSHPEPTHWPHDPEKRLATYRQRIVWSDLRDAFLASAEVAEGDPARYAAMASAARARMAEFASVDAVETALREALATLPDLPTGGFDWVD